MHKINLAFLCINIFSVYNYTLYYYLFKGQSSTSVAQWSEHCNSTTILRHIYPIEFILQQVKFHKILSILSGTFFSIIISRLSGSDLCCADKPYESADLQMP